MKKETDNKKVSRSDSKALALFMGFLGFSVLILLLFKTKLSLSEYNLLWIEGCIGFAMTVLAVLAAYRLWRSE